MTRPLRIGSWNIRKAVGLDWRRDPARVLRVLGRMNLDIVILQESDKRIAPRPPALPPEMVQQAGWTYIDADPATPSIGHHGNAILLGAGFSMSHFSPLDLPGLEPRGAVLASIAGHGKAFTIGALHLGLRRKDRLRQVDAVLDATRHFDGPAILGGDLNEWRTPGRLAPSSSAWTEIAPGPSFHAAAARFQLDRFLVDGSVDVLGCGVVAAGDTEKASDHLPVWIEVAFRNNT
jgi:endonuclease/exonuclease/phosphatase family metal-dependent hydrolase